MATIIYYTGNGYSCSCCRQSSTNYFDFETPEEAIAECIDIASGSEWDFGINDIKGYDGDAYELEQQIDAAVEKASQAQTLRRKIAQIKSDIATTETWFAQLESTKDAKTKYLNEKRQELEELTK